MKLDMKKFRDECRETTGNPEKRKEVCERWQEQVGQNDFDGVHCSQCGEPISKGQRIWAFRGWGDVYCDCCTLDILEIITHGNRGLSFEDEIGGYELDTSVHGEEESYLWRW